MLLTVNDLSARRGEDLIFTNVSYELTDGEALVLKGRNGSGKSTLIRVLAGLLRPETGSISLTGAGFETGMRVSEACHYLGHRNAMKPELTVAENLEFWRAYFACEWLSVEAAVAAVGLAGIAHLPFGYLSAGQQRRMAMARLLLAHRPIWLLDEPTAALDGEADEMFAGLVRRHRAGGGIVIAATHQALGLDDAREMTMTGFAGAGDGVW